MKLGDLVPFSKHFSQLKRLEKGTSDTPEEVESFEGPVLIIRKIGRDLLFIVPFTSKVNIVTVNQTRHFDYRRMDKILCTITDDDFVKVRDSFIKLFLENKPPASGEAGGRGECQI